jgi:hypothetical protein
MATVRGHVVRRLQENIRFATLATRYGIALHVQGEHDPESRAGSVLTRLDRDLKRLPILQETGASNLEFSRALKSFSRVKEKGP